MKKMVLLITLFSAVLFANSCHNRLFNLKAYGSSVTIQDILRDISLECDLSIVFEDNDAKKKVLKRLDFVNIKNYTLPDLFDFLFHQNNLFYRYEPSKNLLKVAYRKTRNFDVDYINLASMKTESKKSVSLGNSSGYGTNTGYGSTTNTYNNGTSGTYGSSQGGESTDYTSITTTSEFKFWESLKEQLHNFLDDPKSEVFLNKDASIVTVTGTYNEIEKIKRFLQKLQSRMHKQVMIEAKLIEVQYSDDQTTGIDWSQFGMTLTGSRSAQKSRTGANKSLGLTGTKVNNFGVPDYFVGYNFSMQGLIDFLKKYGDVKILSNPKVMTLNNQPAIINVGDQLSYRYENGVVITGGNAVANQTYSIGQTFVGITLYVIPEITQNNDIIMKINPVTSALLSENGADSNRTLPPDIRVKQITSIVKVKDGQKILIGGLVSKNISNTHNKVPVLGDFPLLGNLFKSNKKQVNKSELFILIIPKIISDSYVPTIDEALYFKE